MSIGQLVACDGRRAARVTRRPYAVNRSVGVGLLVEEQSGAVWRDLGVIRLWRLQTGLGFRS